MLGCVLVLSACILLAPVSGSAEVVDSAQSRIANAAFLARVPPQAAASAICLVDTGVDASPDTGAVQARMSLWDDTVDDTSPTKHGTHLATLIAAPENGWGMVGIWPGARVVSVRANVAGADSFSVASIYQGMRRCRSIAAHYGITTILLALGSSEPLTTDERVLLEDEVIAAARSGLVVVAAAGNNSGGPLAAPASLDGVFSVGGVGADGSRCSISADGALLHAPGCGLDAVGPDGAPVAGVQGMSQAAAIVAATIAALRAYRTDLDPEAATQILLDSSSAALGGRALDVQAAFRAAGLAALVGDPPATVEQPPPAPAPPPAPPQLPDLTTTVKQLPKPQIVVRRSRGRLVIVIKNRDRGVAVRVVVHARPSRRARRQSRVALVSRRANRVRLALRTRSRLRVTVRFVDPSSIRPTSRPTVVRLATARDRSR